ncbi:hypothetical protein [Nostoc sp.]
MPNYGRDRNVIDCPMFTNTPDSIIVSLPDFLLASGGGFFSAINFL